MTRISLAAVSTAALLLSAAPSFAGTIFVSNEKDNTITALNSDTLEVIKTIKVARRPRGIVLSPDFKELFVAAGDGDIMDVIDTKTLEVTRQLESGPDPELMAVDSKGDIIYIASKNGVFAGPSNIAYGAAKADQAHQVRLLAAELGEFGIRVNGVNPDGVVRGSGIFAKGWGAQRAAVYGSRAPSQ